MAEPRIQILLATYNSARFLEPQLESLIAQTRCDFELVASDDCSTDDTIAILERHAPRFAIPPRILRRATPSGSASANFAGLLAGATAPYVMLADHDDVWLPDKVERAIAALEAAERVHGAETPILYHSDLDLIDGAGAPIAGTLWRLKKIDPAHGRHLRGALVHATVTGCTAAMNHALVRRAVPVPEGAMMHDWWLNLVAAALGQVIADPVPSMRYRLHGGNVSNPGEVSMGGAMRQRGWRATVRRKMARRIVQAQALEAHLGDALTPADARAVHALASLDALGPIARRTAIVRNGLFYPGLWRNAAVLLGI